MSAESIALAAINPSTWVAGGGQILNGITGMEDSRRARKRQENLERERREQLLAEAADKAAAKKKAAGAGKTAGSGSRNAVLGNIGFGSGNVTAPSPSSNIFGN